MNSIFRIEFFKINNFYINFGILSFFILLLILAIVTSNYGIAFRQKWMVLPFLIIIISQKRKRFI